MQQYLSEKRTERILQFQSVAYTGKYANQRLFRIALIAFVFYQNHLQEFSDLNNGINIKECHSRNLCLVVRPGDHPSP